VTATSPVRELRKQVRDLKCLLAKKALEVDFFKGALQKIEARRRSAGDSGERHLRPNPGDDADARQPDYRAHVRVDESQPDSFYRSFEQREPQEESMEVRSAIQRGGLGASPALRLSESDGRVETPRMPLYLAQNP
jgi:hypothetical protein